MVIPNFFFAMKKSDAYNDATLTLKLFDSLVTPILTYSIEVWGLCLLDEKKLNDNRSYKCIFESPYRETLNIKLCKYILGISHKSCNDVTQGEFGRYPILLLSIHHWVNYVKHCYTWSVHDFACASSTFLYELFTSQCNYSWAAKMFNLISIVFPDVTVNPHNLFRPGIPIRVKDFYTKRYDESWLLSINKNYDPNSQNKLKMYASIKNVFAVENYVLALPMMKCRHFTKLCISLHHLAIEAGRYTRPITPKNARFWNNCD